MVEFLADQNLINERFILERCGYEARGIIEACRIQAQSQPQPIENLNSKRSLRQKIKDRLLKRWLGEDYEFFYEIGKFRRGGEIHQWMYDQYSLGSLLESSGFENIKVCSAYESSIKNWEQFGLELIDGNVRKPDSLFMEASK
jgi:hypothetical protein